MANATDYAEEQALALCTGTASTPPATPMTLALVTVVGDDATPGTEVTGGSYARQQITFTTGGSAVSNDTLVSFTNMPACTVVGVEIWDSAATPRRWWHLEEDSSGNPISKSVGSGDTLQFAAGEVDLAAG